MPDKTSTDTRPDPESLYTDLLEANEAMGRRIDELEAQLAYVVVTEPAWPNLSGRYWPVSS